MITGIRMMRINKTKVITMMLVKKKNAVAGEDED